MPESKQGVRMPKVLVACEESQSVTIELRNLGIEAYSCDILECSGGHPEWHIQGDVIPLLSQTWDMVIAFPPCTYLCSSGMHWTTRGLRDPQLTEDAVEFVKKIWNMDCPRIAIENSIGVLSNRLQKPDQIIQPWMFGEDASKQTCLWLKGLPQLTPTSIFPPKGWEQSTDSSGEMKKVNGFWFKNINGGKLPTWGNQTASGQNKLGPSEDRSRIRSKTYRGVAKSMATQWSKLLLGDEEPKLVTSYKQSDFELF